MAQRSDREYLDIAARAALRGRGHVEPNPCVGAVIVAPDGGVIGIGHHARFGDVHAEVAALGACRLGGHEARGATMYVTLEPCGHFGKQPPCTGAILEAGIARVVVARPDPNPVSAGGADRLRAGGVRVDFCAESAAAVRVSDAFLTGLRRARPYVIAKWAQSLDGCVATLKGESTWISGEESRRRVHALRGRVDAVIVGIGTVLADDPLLTARGVPVRRAAARVVIDSTLRLPAKSQLVRTARTIPTIVACSFLFAALQLKDYTRRRAELEALGVVVLDPNEAAPAAAVPGRDASRLYSPRHARRATHEASWSGVGPYAWEMPRQRNVHYELHPPPSAKLVGLTHTLGLLHARGMANVLVEPGPTLLASLLSADLADELRVYIAPMALGEGRFAVRGFAADTLRDGRRFELARTARRGADLELTYLRPRGYLEISATSNPSSHSSSPPSMP